MASVAPMKCALARCAWWLGAVAGCLACALLVVNNLRDIPTDVVAGKRTLAVRIGDHRTRLLYVGLLGATFVLLVIVALSGRPGALAGLLAMPLVAMASQHVLGGAKGRDLIRPNPPQNGDQPTMLHGVFEHVRPSDGCVYHSRPAAIAICHKPRSVACSATSI